nr:MAG TPA: hypothetical protein [Caudoviricetes sp.]
MISKFIKFHFFPSFLLNSYSTLLNFTQLF